MALKTSGGGILRLGTGGIVLKAGGGGSGVVNPDNSILISEPLNASRTNVPMQMGNLFLEGDIPDYPQVLIDGSPVTTQANVMMRWPDGSVKHAIMCFILPAIAALGSKTLTFQNQGSGNTTGGLTKAQMLDAAYNFDATITLTHSSEPTVNASARTMLNADHYTTWFSGSVATSVIIADHSASKTYDVGFSATKPFRPIFLATFWPSLNAVQIRPIGEIGSPTNVESFTAATTNVTLGQSSPASLYSKASSTVMTGLSRWTRTPGWINHTQPSLNIKYNIEYLSSTYLLPNYDPTITVPSGTISSRYTTWTGTSRGIYDAGQWRKVMADGGGRPDIGMMPEWTTRWLYTGDYRDREVALGHADLATAWPVHLRESVAGKNFTRSADGAGLGRFCTVNGRPALFYPQADSMSGSGADRIILNGTYTDSGWAYDCAHQPDPFSLPYLLTGDFFYLEEMWFWAARNAFETNPNGTSFNCRGPNTGGIHQGARGHLDPAQVRAQAWTFRNHCLAAAFTPDSYADEKTYFTTLINECIEAWEGMRGVSASPQNGSTMYNWGASVLTARFNGHAGSQGVPWTALGGVFSEPNGAAVQGWSTADVKLAFSPWELHFLVICLGRAKELGFRTDSLLEWVAPFEIGKVTNPASIDPRYIAAFRFPAVDGATTTYYTTWAQVQAAFDSAHPVDGAQFISTGGMPAAFTSNVDDVTHGYANIAMAAMSYLTPYTSGSTAWAWVETNIKNASRVGDTLSNNPKWALVPRV